MYSSHTPQYLLYDTRTIFSRSLSDDGEDDDDRAVLYQHIFTVMDFNL